MRKIIIGGVAAALSLSGALASGVFADAGGSGPIAWVNGGGQVFADPATAAGGGPGDTIAFVAQELTAYADADDNARGQLQFVPRGESGQTTKFHGVVTCANIDGNDLGMATFGGYNRDDNTLFQVRVVDTGESGTDMIGITYPTDGDNPCADQNDDNTDLTLARGNVTIHKQG